MTPHCIDNPRPTWAETFMVMALTVSRRSHDAETKHGAVITTKNNRILSTGLNGFWSDVDDSDLPNTRPEKYPYMRHAERNAVRNISRHEKDMVCYVTGEPCNDCLCDLWENGIRKVVHLVGHGSHDNVYDQKVRDDFFRLTQGRMVMEPFLLKDHAWVAEMLKEIDSEGRRISLK